MTQLAFDVYPRSDPRDGTRLVRLTNQDYLDGTGYQAQRRGAGAGTIILSALHSAVAAGYLAEGNYVRVVDLDLGASGEVVGGIWLNEGEVVVLSDKEGGGKTFKIGGQGPLYYLHNAVIPAEARSPSAGPQDQFNIDTYGKWRWGVAADGTSNGETFGGILRRVILEAWLDDPSGIPAIGTDLTDAAASLDWSDVHDSNGAVWPSTDGLYEITVGDNLLDVTATLMAEGIDLRMDPDTFVITAYIAGTDGTDRTGASFGAGVVRFAGGVNIASDLKRAIHESVYVSHMRVIGDDAVTFVEVVDPDWSVGDPVVWGSIQLSVTHDTASMTLFGLHQIAARKLQTDQATFPHVPGDDESAGAYTPGPVNGHYWIGDLVTIHTGTAEHDYNEQSIEVGAISYILRDAGDWDIQVELGSNYIAFPNGTSFQGGGPAICGCGGRTPLPDANAVRICDWSVTVNAEHGVAHSHEVGYVGSDGSDIVVWTTGDPTGGPFSIPAKVTPATWYLKDLVCGYRFPSTDATHCQIVDGGATVTYNFRDGRDDCGLPPGTGDGTFPDRQVTVVASNCGYEIADGDTVGTSPDAARADHNHEHNDLLLRSEASEHPAASITETTDGDVQTAIDNLRSGGSGFANPMTTAGDLIVGGTAGAPARLGKGSDGQVLTVDPTTHLLVWADPPGGGGLTIEEVDGTPSVAADTLKMPNGTLTDNGDGSVTYTPGTIAVGSVVYPLDSYPLDPTYGILFNGASLPAALTRRGFTSGAETYQVGSDGGRLRSVVYGRAAGDGYYMPVSGDGTWAMKFRIHGNWFGWGIGIVNSVGTGVSSGIYNNPYGWLELTTNTYTSYGGGFQEAVPGFFDSAITSMFHQHRFIWCYLRRSGNNYFTSYSLDGDSWLPETPALSAAITVDRIYMGLDSLPSSSSPNYFVEMEWFNKIA